LKAEAMNKELFAPVLVAIRKLGKKESSMFGELVAAIKAAWPEQPTGADYVEGSKLAQSEYVAAGGSKSGAAFAWSKAIEAAGIKPMTKEGKIIERKGKSGPKAKAKPAKAAPVPASQISDAEAVLHFFGHSDADLITAVRIAAAHEQAFLRWADAQAKASKPQAVAKAA